MLIDIQFAIADFALRVKFKIAAAGQDQQRGYFPEI